MPIDIAAVLPVYLETAFDDVFGLFHTARRGRSTGSAVLVCAPWGWEETASYRSRRAWAERLAAAGHPTLRFDLPAAGDSAGRPRDPGRVEAWVAAVAAGADWLRHHSGSERVAVLGLGLGGLLARAALAGGTRVDDLVLWASPARGRGFAREARAFSRLQTWEQRAGDGSAPPEGWLEAGGFLLTSETLDSLKGLDPGPPVGLSRALLLDRDGVEVDPALREQLEGAGVAVTTEAGPGWGEMVSHPERTRPPQATIETVSDWLGTDRGTGAGTAPPPLPRPLDLTVGERPVLETPLTIAQPYGDAFGVLTEPRAGRSSGLCLVFLNAGAIRHIGPNRLWVEAARRWAGRGLAGLRLDLEAIGEADGDESRFTEVSEFYVPGYEEQVTRSLDALEERGYGDRFMLIGLCAGGYWAFRTALGDRRVSAALLLNAGALSWRSGLIAEREARKLGRALRLGWWNRFLKREVRRPKLRALGRSVLSKARQSTAREGDSGDWASGFDADFKRLAAKRTRLTMGFSGDEPLAEELEAAGVPGRLDAWPEVELAALPGHDHTLRPLDAQRAAHDLIDREVELARSRVR